jgi:hypothetical protein
MRSIKVQGFVAISWEEETLIHQEEGSRFSDNSNPNHDQLELRLGITIF